jgi:hypothetical protein
LNVPLIKQFLQLGLQLCQLIRRHWICSLIDRGSARLKLDLELSGPIRGHPRKIIEKYIQIFTDHLYLIQTLGNNSVNRCLEMSNRWQLQRNLAVDRSTKRVEMSNIAWCIFIQCISRNTLIPWPFKTIRLGGNTHSTSSNWILWTI